MVGHFKQLCNNSQERILVAVATYTYLLVQTVIVHVPRLATASEFCCMKLLISFATGCTIDTHSSHCCTLLITVAQLTHRVRARPGGLLARFSAGLSWPSNKLSDTVREKSSNSFGMKTANFYRLEL